MPFFRKKGVEGITHIFQSQTYIGVKSELKSLFRGEFCIMTKMCLGIYFKPLFTHVYTCISEWPPWGAYNRVISIQ